jgi:hypothetical protein
MAEQVQVQNVSNRLVTLVLAGKHLAAAKKGAAHRYKPVKLVTVHHAKDGQLAIRARKVPMADAVRIPSGAKVVLDKSATFCPDFKKAVAAKRIKVLADPFEAPPEKKSEKPSKAPAPPPAAPTSTSSDK